MKIRASYVSNSSSSSYVVVFRPEAKLEASLPDGSRKEIMTADQFIEKIYEDGWKNGSYAEATQIHARGKEQVKEYLGDRENFYNEEWADGIIAKIDSEVEYPDAAALEISYSDRLTKTILDCLVATGAVKVLDDES